jgi:mono/diheme cytochrome c family protein
MWRPDWRMTMSSRLTVFASVALLAPMVQGACSPRAPADEAAAPAQIDSASSDSVVPRRDTVPSRSDSVAVRPDTSSPRRDTVATQPDSAAQSSTGQGGFRVSRLEYDGWRQYSVNCARCHGQDVLPNPVAANLLISVGPGGPVASEQMFVQVVSEGRPHRGMPAFKGVLTPDQINAIYAYVRGRAEKRLPPGRPERPA